jgi:hypothetical protein
VRYKIVPPARDREFLFEVRDALPLVPGSENDCCARIRDRTAVPSRAEARKWLTYCVALGLAAETDRGYHRIRDEPDVADLGERLLENVYPAREALASLREAGPSTADQTFEALRDRIPRWERSRHADWAAEWRERVANLLGWCVAFGLARRDGDVYRAGPSKD